MLSPIEEIDFDGKKVFLRLDLNVPMASGEILDSSRIDAALPTIQFLKEKNAKIIIASHLGRPKGVIEKELSIEPIGVYIGDHFNADVIVIDHPSSEVPKNLLPASRSDQIIFLENLRFEKGETENSLKLAHLWASYSDIYINDAFGACHRAHASIDALPNLMEIKAPGFLIHRELEALSGLINKESNSFWVVLGGSKLSDKIPLLENLIDKVDGFVIGGAMAYTFLKAKGVEVGNSMLEKAQIKFAGEFIERIEARGKNLILPIDHVVAGPGFSDVSVTSGNQIPPGKIGYDIGPQTSRLIAKQIESAGKIFWNGPLGYFEKSQFSRGSFEFAKSLSNSTAEIKVIGGGDSVSAAKKSGVSLPGVHMSTGGGASLEYLQGNKLPGLSVLGIQ